MMDAKLSESEIAAGLKTANGWARDGIVIKKTFVRKGFVDAVDFVQKLVAPAEEMDHHPDIRIFAYKRVEIAVSTHSVGGLTRKDFELAQKIDAIVS